MQKGPVVVPKLGSIMWPTLRCSWLTTIIGASITAINQGLPILISFVVVIQCIKKTHDFFLAAYPSFQNKKYLVSVVYESLKYSVLLIGFFYMSTKREKMPLLFDYIPRICLRNFYTFCLSVSSKIYLKVSFSDLLTFINSIHLYERSKARNQVYRWTVQKTLNSVLIFISKDSQTLF